MPLPRIAVISDSPKVHTGFATVVRAVVSRLYDTSEYFISQYGLLDNQPDFNAEVPWVFIPTPALDDLGHRTYTSFIRAQKPDVVLIIQPPSNARRYNAILSEDCQVGGKNPKIVLYTPVEGSPLTRDSIDGIKMANKVVAYCENGRDIIKAMTGVEAAVAYHGWDHEPWDKYEPDLRRKIKRLIHFDDRFIVGAIGVNKRTKGHVELLQVARILKERGRRDILFYLHTNPDKETMLGYDLRYLAEYYGVRDMVQWRIVFDDMSYWKGHPAVDDTRERMLAETRDIPETAEQRGMLFASFDMRTIINTFDLFVDISQNEGWGLPLHEAMACGVPSLTVDDLAVRSEVWQDGPHFIEPIPFRMWPSLHTGAKLVTIDPEKVADAIEFYVDYDGARQELSDKCYHAARRYTWDDCASVIKQAIDELVHTC